MSIIKEYVYQIDGLDGRGYSFQVFGKISCKYEDAWQVANTDCIRKLLSEKSDCHYICPLNIINVMINQSEASLEKYHEERRKKEAEEFNKPLTRKPKLTTGKHGESKVKYVKAKAGSPGPKGLAELMPRFTKKS